MTERTILAIVAVVLLAEPGRGQAGPADLCPAGIEISECNANLGYAALDRGEGRVIAHDLAAARVEFEAAADFFKKSFAISHETNRLAMYGHALLKARHYDRAKKALQDARERLSDAAATAPALASSLSQLIALVDNDLQDLQNRCVEVHLRYAGGNPPVGLNVARKGEENLTAPFAESVLMEGGTDALVVEYPDGRSLEIPVDAPPGTARSKTIPVLEIKRNHRLLWLGIGFLGVATVGSIAGIVEYRSSTTTLDNQGCFEAPNGTLTGCKDTAVAQSAADRQTLSERVLVGAGVFALAGIVALTIDLSQGRDPSLSIARFQVQPTAHGAIVGYERRF